MWATESWRQSEERLIYILTTDSFDGKDTFTHQRTIISELLHIHFTSNHGNKSGAL